MILFVLCYCPGLEELCDGLRQQTAGVKVLLLRNNQITANGLVHLAQALVRSTEPTVSLKPLMNFVKVFTNVKQLDYCCSLN